MSEITLGNDISRWQGDVNFDTLKNNCQFLIIKASEGVGFVDPKFSRNKSEARRVGLPLGYYHFAHPDLGNFPETEAEYFLKTIGELQLGELLVLDYEPPNQKQTDVDWCRKWLDYVYSKTGVRALIYLNQSQVKKFNWQSVVDGGYGLWIAAYTGDPTKNNYEKGQWTFAAMQQWTNAQQVPGISGNVDGNVFFGTLDTLKKYGYRKGQNTEPQPTPTPIPTPIVITNPNQLLFIGKLNDVEYGDMSLENVRIRFGAALTALEIGDKNIEGLNTEIDNLHLDLQRAEAEAEGYKNKLTQCQKNTLNGLSLWEALQLIFSRIKL